MNNVSRVFRIIFQEHFCSRDTLLKNLRITCFASVFLPNIQTVLLIKIIPFFNQVNDVSLGSWGHIVPPPNICVYLWLTYLRFEASRRGLQPVAPESHVAIKLLYIGALCRIILDRSIKLTSAIKRHGCTFFTTNKETSICRDDTFLAYMLTENSHVITVPANVSSGEQSVTSGHYCVMWCENK